MTFNFPNTPTLGQTFAPADGPLYVWDGSAWRAIGPGAPATVRVGDAPPANPVAGQLWWESDTGKLFIWYTDVDSSAWVHIFSGPKGERGPAGDGTYDTAIGMATTIVPGDVDAIRTSGYALAGDGGAALYKRVVSAPAHAGKVQSMDGAWWEIADQPVNVRMFGAKGDGVVDDTTAVHAAIAYTKTAGKELLFPSGTYRVTSGYADSVYPSNLVWRGEGRTKSIVKLDNAAVDRFFYDYTGGSSHYVDLKDLKFMCAQLVPDTDFFRFTTATICVQQIERVMFDTVDRPLVYKAGVYLESSSFIKVQFWNSGTIYSDSNVGARGNIITMIDVSHGGTMPPSTAKIVMNLQGWRGIQATNLLLQGSLPSTGWTVLKLDNNYSADWVHDNVIEVNGFWSEWTGNGPLYTVEQYGSRSTWKNCFFEPTTGTGIRKLKLAQRGQLDIHNTSFIGNVPADTLASMFEVEDDFCHVTFTRCNFRYGVRTDLNHTFINCIRTIDSSAATNHLAKAVFGTSQSSLIWKWKGGYVDPDGAQITFTGGATYYPSVDTVYGRKLVIATLPASGSANIVANVRGSLLPGRQVNIVGLLKFPTYSGGSINVTPLEDSAALSGGGGYDSTYSGQLLQFNMGWKSVSAATNIGMRILTVSPTGLTGNLEIYAFAMYFGNEVPREEYPDYPLCVVTHGTAIPTLGEWRRGDVIWNSTPAAAGIPGWVCVTAGTPGTWKAMGVLAA